MNRKRGLARLRRIQKRAQAKARFEVKRAEKRTAKRKRRLELGNFTATDFRSWGGAL